jgi:hypothetical protein
MLEMQLPVGLGDRVGVERTILPELLQDAREQRPNPLALDRTVDDDVRDVPCGPNSRAILCEIMRRPALLALKWAKPGIPRSEPVAPVKKMEPRPSGTKRRAASRPTKNPPSVFERQKSSKVEASSCRKSIFWLIPTL